MKISVLGPGRWGSFIAWYLNKIDNEVVLWGREGGTHIKNLIETHKNEYVTFPQSIKFSTNLSETITNGEYIIISIGAQNLRDLMQDVKKVEGYEAKKYILCMKGIEKNTGARLSTVLIDNGVPEDNIAVWVGPGHIQSFTSGVPSIMIIDSYNRDYSKFLATSFKSELIRFYQGNDMIGSEIGSASKNVMGLAAGLLDGMGYSTLKGGLMARGAREISRLIGACGGNPMSAYGLCHLGDYEATLFSEFSHNRRWGESFAKNEPFDKLAEGVDTSSALLSLAKKTGVELPITQTVYDVIQGNITKTEAIKQLFERNNMSEF